MPSVELVGVHEVEADEPCSLVELIVHDLAGPFDIGAITQAAHDRPLSEWQVPFAEKVLDAEGEHVLHDFWDGPAHSTIWRGEMRLVFFFHYLDVAVPLSTPFGDVVLRAPEPRPPRLGWVAYEQP